MKLRATLLTVGLLVLAGVIYVGVRYLPIGLTDAERYFDPVGERRLQDDEIGQLANIFDEYRSLSSSGDLFEGWDRDQRLAWKYAIAFAAYGLPSAMLIAAEQQRELQHLMFIMIQKMKSRLVWGDFTEMGMGEDPISYQNIMYKAHLNLMYGLYQLTTGDLRYAREYTWLTNQIVEEMRLHHRGIYEGATCEPDHWFVECNMISLLSLHVYDRLFGTHFTENEVRWTLEFVENRMVDPETGLFYRQYHPSLDVVDRGLLGYNNAWIIAFLSPIRPEWAQRLYPVWKDVFVSEYGPYATVDGKKGGSADATAHVFGMWAAKEMGDIDLYSKLRNTTDQLIGFEHDEQARSITYDYEGAYGLNGVVLATKIHTGWKTVLQHDWGHGGPVAVPDVSAMVWTDLLPTEVYDLDPKRPLPESVEGRECPNCLWGDLTPMRIPDAAKKLGATHVPEDLH